MIPLPDDRQHLARMLKRWVDDVADVRLAVYQERLVNRIVLCGYARPVPKVQVGWWREGDFLPATTENEQLGTAGWKPVWLEAKP